MFSTFHKGDRAIIVRTEYLRRIEDAPHGCVVVWDEGGEIREQAIDGTADENLDRLITEDLARQDLIGKAQARRQAGYPGLPVQRGKTNGS